MKSLAFRGAVHISVGIKSPASWGNACSGARALVAYGVFREQ